MNPDSHPQQWIDQVDGPAALLRPTPWRFTPNAALARLLPPADREQVAICQAFGAGGDDLMDHLARGQPFHGRLRGPAPGAGGTASRLLHVDLAPCGPSGDWLCTFVDLTPVEGMRSRRALTLERLRHTLDQLQEMISMLDHEENMLFANASYKRFFGVDGEIPGIKLVQALGEENYAWTAPYRAVLFSTVQPVNYERILLDSSGEDRVMGILLWPIKDERGGLSKMVALTRDVTLRHRGMVALRQTLERLDALLEAGIEGIVLCEHGVITDANPVACRHFGLSREHVVGQPLSRMLQALGMPFAQTLPDDCQTWQSLQLCLLPGTSGAPPLQVEAITFQDDDIPCHAVLLQDMTYRYLAQRRIDRLVTDLRRQTARAAAADRAKSVFLASASHDLRQPIHSLGLFLTTIRSLSRTPLPLPSDALRPIVQRMRSSLDGLMQLLDMLLGATMLEASAREITHRPIALQTLFDELVQDFTARAAAKGLALRAVPTRAWVSTDPTVLRRILTNLVANAVRYTERGRIVLGARSRGARVEVQVWDTGVGIPNEQLDAIFQEFYRVDGNSRPGGRSEGLGLAIVKRSAAQLEVDLDLRSTPGRGSMFSVLLPRCEPRQTDRVDADAQAGHPVAVSKHVLLIDDDEQVLLATTHLLESWGHHVLAAGNARDAMRLCEAAPHRIDTVICDYLLGPTMDGLELMLRLRMRYPGPLPVCMVTGDMSEQRQEQARRHGFTLLHKPVSAGALRQFLLEG